jgi:hypothetical protein
MIPFSGKLKDQQNLTQDDLRFYHSKFPLCDGIADPDWKYTLHMREDIWLNADYMKEYVLHVRDNSGTMQVETKFRIIHKLSV